MSRIFKRPLPGYAYLLFALVLVPICGIGVPIGLRIGDKASALSNRGLERDATIVSVSPGECRSTCYLVGYEFRTDDHVFSGSYTVGRIVTGVAGVGDHVEVVYDPRDPNRSDIASSRWAHVRFPYLMAFFPLLVVVPMSAVFCLILPFLSPARTR